MKNLFRADFSFSELSDANFCEYGTKLGEKKAEKNLSYNVTKTIELIKRLSDLINLGDNKTNIGAELE